MGSGGGDEAVGDEDVGTARRGTRRDDNKLRRRSCSRRGLGWLYISACVHDACVLLLFSLSILRICILCWGLFGWTLLECEFVLWCVL